MDVSNDRLCCHGRERVLQRMNFTWAVGKGEGDWWAITGLGMTPLLSVKGKQCQTKRFRGGRG